MKRDLLQLAKTYRPDKDNITGWYISEKLDGIRVFWDGGVSRGVPTEQVPWAGVIDPKTGKRKDKIAPIATGLWSRYGNVIQAPDWFLNQLPCMMLDGELTAGLGKFQLTTSIVRGDEPDPRFDQLEYAVFSTPSLKSIFSTGEIKNTHQHTSIDYDRCLKFIEEHMHSDHVFLTEPISFEHELGVLREALDVAGPVYMLQQTKIHTHDEVEARMSQVLEKGGEGVVIRHPDKCWSPKRVSYLLKYKPFEDDEGRLVGFTSGRETELGSKHRGKIGALILDYHGKRLEISGLTDEEREFVEGSDYAFNHPDEDMPCWVKAKHFTRGQLITFRYREFTEDGLPREARYFRPRSE